jgi:predicted DCC family thiol-disulfide oxidoreductase YuxK
MPPDAFRLLYDGQCPFCRREAEWLARRGRKGRMELVDISDPQFEPGRFGVTREEVHAVLHGILPDGRMVRRIEALQEAYRAAGLGWLAAPLSWPGIHWLADKFYGLFARHRVRLGRLFGRAADRHVAEALAVVRQLHLP